MLLAVVFRFGTLRSECVSAVCFSSGWTRWLQALAQQSYKLKQRQTTDERACAPFICTAVTAGSCCCCWVVEVNWSRRDLSIAVLLPDPWPGEVALMLEQCGLGAAPIPCPSWVAPSHHCDWLWSWDFSLGMASCQETGTGYCGWLFLLPCKCFVRRWVSRYDLWVT